jgi:hypothetical protein
VRAGGVSETLRRAVIIPRQSPLTHTSRIDSFGVKAEMLFTVMTPASNTRLPRRNGCGTLKRIRVSETANAGPEVNAAQVRPIITAARIDPLPLFITPPLCRIGQWERRALRPGRSNGGAKHHECRDVTEPVSLSFCDFLIVVLTLVDKRLALSHRDYVSDNRHAKRSPLRKTPLPT